MIGKVQKRHIEALRKTDAFSDALFVLVAGGAHQSEVAKTFALSRRHLERHCHAARVRVALSEAGCPLEDLGVSPYALIRVGDATAVAAAVAGGASLRAAVDEVGGTPFGLFEKPADVFAAALKEAGDSLPPAFQLLTLAAQTLCFDTAIADLERGGACIQDVIFALEQIEVHLVSLLSEPTQQPAVSTGRRPTV